MSHHCATCTDLDRRGYCAPLRCYCGHDTCHAAASYETPAPLNVTSIKPPDERLAQSWAQREEPTWLDR